MFHSTKHWARSKRFAWIEHIFGYFKNNPTIDFEAMTDRALHQFFPSEHETVIPGTHEQELADTRFWDFLLFEFRDHALDEKTPLEYACKHADLPKKDRDYMKVLQKEHYYSLFKVIKINGGESVVLTDLAEDGTYEIKEYKATFQLKIHDVLMWRIVPDENNDWRFAPGNPSLIDSYVAIPLIHGLERIKKKEAQEKADGFTALIIEELMYSERKDSDFKDAFRLEQDEQVVIDFLRKYKSSLTLEDIKSHMYEETDKEYRNLLPWIVDSCKKMPDKDATGAFFEALNNISNHTSRKMFDGQTPAERNKDRDFPQGSIEITLKQDFFQTAAHYFDENCYPSTRVMNHMAEKFQKIWLDSPQPAIDGKKPMEAILKERKKLGNPEKEFGLDYFCNSIGGDTYKLIPLNEIKLKGNTVLHDVNVLLEYISKKKEKALILTPKKEAIKEQDFNWLLDNFVGKSTLCYQSKKGKAETPGYGMYPFFCIKVAELAGLLQNKGESIALKPKKYEEFLGMDDSHKFLKLFYTWYFAKAKDWSYLLMEDIFERISLLVGIGHFTDQRETALAHIMELGKKQSFDNFFWKFYGSKREKLEKDKKTQTELRIIVIMLIIQHFNVFGLLECYTKSNIRFLCQDEDFLKLDGLKLTDLGQKLMPHIVDELYLRDLDRRSTDGYMEAFIEVINQNSATITTPHKRPETGRNEPCPCESGKKYKKCCL